MSLAVPAGAPRYRAGTMRNHPRVLALLLAGGLAVLAPPMLAPAVPAIAAPNGPGDALRSTALAVDPFAAPPPTDLTAAGWLVADLDTGQVLAAKDGHGRFAPASTLKVLTALALLPQVPVSAVIVPSQTDVNVEGSKVGLLRGVPYPAEEVYSSLLMVSGNDAANALASAVGGQARAATLMNATAQRLGAGDTTAVNPHGLDAPGQVSSPYDLATLGRAALNQPDIARWVSTKRGTVSAGPDKPRFEIDNHNRLLTSYPGALGIKNGYTDAAGGTLVAAATRGGRRLVVALMRSDPRVWPEAQRLLDWGFAASVAGARPVGRLPDPEAAAPGPTAPSGGPALGSGDQPAPPQPDVAAVAYTTGPLGLDPREVAGALLALAALAAVRRPIRPKSPPRRV